MAIPLKNKLAVSVLVVLILSGITFGWFTTSIKVTDIKPGSWGLSKIVEIELEGGAKGFSTQAMIGRLAENVQAFYPPMNENGVGYTGQWALVRLVGQITGELDADTIIFPDLDTTLAELSVGDRRRFVNDLTSRLTGLTYQDYKGKVVNVNFSLKESNPMIAEIGHAVDHAEYLDDFSTDPADRWTVEGQNYVWDSVNEEMDITYSGNTAMIRYSANDPGSIEHEAQINFLAGSGRGSGPAVRFFNDGTNIAYGVDMSSVNAGTGEATMSIIRVDTVLASVVIGDLDTSATTHWWKIRVAASGGVGANVELSAWKENGGPAHQAKPSDTGWIGDDGSPNLTYTDTSVDRLDDNINIQTGIIGRTPGSDYDTRHDFFKQRAISDREGEGAQAAVEDVKIKGGVNIKGGINFK